MGWWPCPSSIRCAGLVALPDAGVVVVFDAGFADAGFVVALDAGFAAAGVAGRAGRVLVVDGPGFAAAAVAG